MWVKHLEGKVSSLNLHLSEDIKARGAAASEVEGQSFQSETLESRTRLFRDELDLLKRLELTSCGMEVDLRRVMFGKSSMNYLTERLHWSTMDSYHSIRSNVEQLLVEVSSWLKGVFDCKAIALQRGVRDAICVAAGDVQKAVVDVPDVVGNRLRLIAEQGKRGDLATPGPSSRIPAGRESQANGAKAHADSESVPMIDAP